MNRMGIVVGVFVVLLLVAVVLSLLSRQKNVPGLVVGKLAPCPDSPNCLCSEYPEHAAYVEALTFEGDDGEAWKRVRSAVLSTGGRIVREETTYLAAIYTSPIFRFVDDLELRMDGLENRIHIRSASRVGHSDLGANRKRVERIRARFSELSL